MDFTDIRLKFIRFFQNNKYKIFIGLIILTIIIAINVMLGRMKDAEPPSTIYEPHTPIISGDKVTSKKTQNKIEEKIKNYMDSCMQKDYETAYNMLSDECKEYKFKNKIENFKTYINAMFADNRVYSIQDYSNKDNVYIYLVSIFEDIMASGMNNEESDEVEEEKVALTKDGDDFKISVGGFIKVENFEKVLEDDYMKISVVKKVTYYDKCIYTLKIKNKTNKTIVFDRNLESNWITASLNGEERNEARNIYGNYEKSVRGGNTKEFDIEIPAYFDEEKQPSSIKLNKVYVLDSYTGVDELWEQESQKAVKKYSVTINL